MQQKLFFFLLCSVFFSSIPYAYSQEDQLAQLASELPLEKIVKISPSRRIYIVTNANNSVSRGDFVTMVFENQKAVRALVAKVTDEIAALKVVNTYDDQLKSQMNVNKEIRIIRGDDSSFKVTEVSQEDDDLKIEDEDDLYNDTVLTGGIEISEDKGRSLKTDNLVSLSLSRVGVLDINGEGVFDNQISGQWAYQLFNDIWAEVSYGFHFLNDYPTRGLDTKVTNIVGRIKYSLAAPLDSFIMPYVGYRLLDADSKDAGVPDPNLPEGPEFYKAELARVDALKKSGIVAGVTIIKRFVPGWFYRLDLGTDLFAAGVSLEF